MCWLGRSLDERQIPFLDAVSRHGRVGPQPKEARHHALCRGLS
jgi:hypothetical protein